MSDYRIYEARAAIAGLPGKTYRPWKDRDAWEHCSFCRLCGECYPTRVVAEHEKECTDALLSALQALSWYRSRSQGPADQPAPTETGPKCEWCNRVCLPGFAGCSQCMPMDREHALRESDYRTALGSGMTPTAAAEHVSRLAAHRAKAEPAPTETACTCAAQLDTLRTHAEWCPKWKPAPTETGILPPGTMRISKFESISDGWEIEKDELLARIKELEGALHRTVAAADRIASQVNTGCNLGENPVQSANALIRAVEWYKEERDELPANQPAPTETGPIVERFTFDSPLGPNHPPTVVEHVAEPAPQGAPLCSSAEPNELATEGHFFTGGRCKWCDVRMLEASNRCNLTAVREVVQ